MTNSLALKEKLQTLLEEITSKEDFPVTNLTLDKSLVEEIEQLTTQVEEINPNPQPLVNAVNLLNGKWLLQYSTAREIRSLSSLPLGLKIGRVYQEIDVANKSFSNLAFVKHPWGLVSGSVKVTATFEPAEDETNKRINVQFDKRYLSIENIFGIQTPKLNPFKVVQANNPQGRIPTLDVTYIDETLRIGRGGDGSLFILKRA
ncbi:PAP fibrillin [Calothrix parasitica NIES-267]|uniref:PAP fibrillin n=1 Tax=Calothrix parasitica NIES-267 TaxID=1973488 RepID=A0A1Z4M280_9CYAN|nr:PAP fibrillin [Calothrix parasitica NIES-267]